jgi:hypothetical protein
LENKVRYEIKANQYVFYMRTALGKQQAVVSKEELQERERRRKGETVAVELRHFLQHSGSLSGWENKIY